jgi:hypothetical protein
MDQQPADLAFIIMHILEDETERSINVALGAKFSVLWHKNLDYGRGL